CCEQRLAMGDAAVAAKPALDVHAGSVPRRCVGPRATCHPFVDDLGRLLAVEDRACAVAAAVRATSSTSVRGSTPVDATSRDSTFRAGTDPTMRGIRPREGISR